LNLTREEVKAAKERFNLLDKERKGHITVNDIRRHFRVSFYLHQVPLGSFGAVGFAPTYKALSVDFGKQVESTL
jgi:hypothetical protein